MHQWVVTLLDRHGLGVHEANDVLDGPNPIRQSRSLSRRHLTPIPSKRLVRTAVVVIHEKETHGVGMILRLLAEGISKSGETEVLHPKCQVAPLDVAG